MIIYTCKICRKEVYIFDKEICFDHCNNWAHHTCNLLNDVDYMWRIGLFHPTKSLNHRIFKDVTIFYNTSLHRENIILTK